MIASASGCGRVGGLVRFYVLNERGVALDVARWSSVATQPSIFSSTGSFGLSVAAAPAQAALVLRHNEFRPQHVP